MIIRFSWLPFNIAAICVWKNLIFAHKYAGDDFIEHEKVHEKEWTLLWLIQYLLYPVFRMKAEVRAYTVQAKFNHRTMKDYHDTIRDCYLLNKRAKNMLDDYIKQVEEGKA